MAGGDFFCERQIGGKILRIGDVLEFEFEELLLGVADDVAKFLIYAKPAPIRGNMGDAYGGLLEGSAEAFFTFVQSELEGGAALQNFLGIVNGPIGVAGDEGLVPRSQLNSHFEILGDGGFQDVAARAGGGRLANHFLTFVLAEDEHLSIGKGGADQAGGLQAVEVRHADVHHHDVGLKAFCECDGVVAVSGFTADFKTGSGGDQGAHASADDFMVVYNKNANQRQPPLVRRSEPCHEEPSTASAELRMQ